MMKGKSSGGFVSKVIGILVTFIQIIIVVTILLQLFGANQTPFVNFVNSLSVPILRPFVGIFDSVTFNGYTIDLSALFALIVYSVIGFGLQKVIGILRFK